MIIITTTITSCPNYCSWSLRIYTMFPTMFSIYEPESYPFWNKQSHVAAMLQTLPWLYHSGVKPTSIPDWWGSANYGPTSQLPDLTADCSPLHLATFDVACLCPFFSFPTYQDIFPLAMQFLPCVNYSRRSYLTSVHNIVSLYHFLSHSLHCFFIEPITNMSYGLFVYFGFFWASHATF